VARLATDPAQREDAAVTEAAEAAGAALEAALFVSLVGVDSCTALLDRLGLALRLGGGGDAVEQLLSALEGRALLLLLDNAEELDDEAVAVLALLVERLPRLHLLATSRRPLALDGEQVFPLPTLPLPAPDDPLPEVAMNPAVALFVDRARAHRPEFQVNASQCAALVALMQRLDGLPLAIELAASHARTLRPADLLALLQQAEAAPGAGLSLLARRGVRGGSDPRHASMWAVVDWSWRRLAPAPRRLLQHLALLPAGATAASALVLERLAAAAEPAAAGPQTAAAAPVLEALVDQSLLRMGAGADGTPRFTPYEPVREFVLAQADEAARRADRGRVLALLLHWAQALPATPPLPAVRDELPNVLQALAAAAGDGRGDDAVRLVLLLQSSWGEIAVPAGVLQVLDALLAAPGLDDALAAGGHALLASRCQEAGRPDDARRHVAAALARPCADPALRIMVLSRSARVLWRLDRDHVRARAMIDEALPLARAHDRPNSEGSLLSLSAHLATMVDRDPARGTALSAQALALWQRSGNRHLINAGRFNVATNRMKAGDHAGVLDEFAALAAEGLELQDWDLAAGALEARGTALLALRRWPEALADLQTSVRVAWDGLEVMALAYALWNVAPVLARLRHGALAAGVMGAAEALWQQRFGAFDDSDRRDLRRVRRFARVLLGAQPAADAWRHGAAQPLSAVVQAVLAAR
jgi:tetratricopeptide (TPR) repeat protein